MNKWVKILAPSVVGTIVTVFVLMLSGLATSTVHTAEGNYVASTVVGLEINAFAAIMLVSVFLSVFVTAYLTNRK